MYLVLGDYMENAYEGSFLDIGFGHYLSRNRVTAIIPISGNKSRFLLKAKKKDGLVFECTKGRAGKSIVILDDKTCYISAFNSEYISKNML